MSSNSVFINYRRSASSYLAQLVWRELTDAGINAFYDIASIDAGQFDQIILNQIAARPYFMPILSPGTLERCQDPGDWVLREMQEALRLQRVIVPLVTEEFSFADFDKYLPPDLAAELKRFNAMPVPPRFFKYAIMEVRDRFLKPIDIFVAPTPKSDAPIIAERIAQAHALPDVTEAELKAQEHLEKGIKLREADDNIGAIVEYDQAIRLNPRLAEAYARRAGANLNLGNFDTVIADVVKALHHDSNNATAYINRGIARRETGDLDGAIADYTKAIQLNPQLALAYLAYYNRGIARRETGDLDGAIADYTKAIHLNSQDADAYIGRGVAQRDKGNFDAAIADYSEALRINPQYADAFWGRGWVYEKQGKMKQAAADYRRFLELQPNHSTAQEKRDFIKKHG